jgi:hypothetical protein
MKSLALILVGFAANAHPLPDGGAPAARSTARSEAITLLDNHSGRGARADHPPGPPLRPDERHLQHLLNVSGLLRMAHPCGDSYIPRSASHDEYL